MGHGKDTERDVIYLTEHQGWHKLGEVIPESEGGLQPKVHVAEVAKRGDIRHVETSPLATVDGHCALDHDTDTPAVTLVEGRLMCVDHTIEATRAGLTYTPVIQAAPDGAATRRDDGSHLSVVTERFEPVIVDDPSGAIIDTLQEILDSYGYRLVTIAGLRDCTRVVGTLLSPHVATIPGDWERTQGQVAFGWSYDSTMAPHCANQAMRNSCYNASELNLWSDSTKRLRSVEGVNAKLTDALVQAVVDEELAFQEYVELASSWTEVDASPSVRSKFTQAFWPTPELAPGADAKDRKTHERKVRNIGKARDVWKGILGSDTIRAHGTGGRYGAGNAYGLWMATTEYMQWHHAVRARGVSSQPLRRYERQTLGEAGQDEQSAMALIALLTDAPMPDSLAPIAEDWEDVLATV